MKHKRRYPALSSPSGLMPLGLPGAIAFWAQPTSRSPFGLSSSRKTPPFCYPNCASDDKVRRLLSRDRTKSSLRGVGGMAQPEVLLFTKMMPLMTRILSAFWTLSGVGELLVASAAPQL